MNDMLRDLDRRGAGPTGEVDSGHRQTPAVSDKGWLWALVPVALLLMGVLGWLLWDGPSNTSSASARLAESSRAEEVSPEAEETEEETAPVAAPVADRPADASMESVSDQPPLSSASVAPSPAAIPSPVSGAPEPRSVEQRIASLLSSARAAHARDRLTRPVGDNAYEYYQQVLALEAEQPQALAGLAAIAQRYRELAEQAMDDKALDRASRFLQRARSVQPGGAGIEGSEQRLAALKAAGEHDDRTGQAPSAVTTAASAVDESDRSGTLSVRPDPSSVDQRAATKARQLWSSGRVDQARSLLQSTLSDWSFESAIPRESADLLFDLYLESGEYSPAQALLERGYWEPPRQTMQRARWALAQGNGTDALTLLEQGAGQEGVSEAYRALMARLYYQQRHFESAAAQYRSLLREPGPRPEYWLGLGLAEDAREQTEAARQAFERALASGAYRRNTEVKSYIERRLSALSREP